MNPFKLDLAHKTVLQKLELGAAHITAMTGNTHYPAGTRVPTDADFAAAQAGLQTANDEAVAAEAAWKEKLAARNVNEAAFDDACTARAANCGSVTPNDPVAVASTGLPLRSAPSPSGPLGAPQNLQASLGDMEGEVDLMWNALKGSSSNVVEGRPRVGTALFAQMGIVQQSRFTAGGLAAGTEYEFRVHGVGKDGNGPHSDIAVCRAA